MNVNARTRSVLNIGVALFVIYFGLRLAQNPWPAPLHEEIVGYAREVVGVIAAIAGCSWILRILWKLGTLRTIGTRLLRLFVVLGPFLLTAAVVSDISSGWWSLQSGIHLAATLVIMLGGALFYAGALLNHPFR